METEKLKKKKTHKKTGIQVKTQLLFTYKNIYVYTYIHIY